MRIVKSIIVVLGLIGISQVIAAAESAKMSVDSKLYASSSIQSSVVANLSQGTDVTIDQRQGGWYQVSDSTGQQGWVRSYDVQTEANGNWFSRLKRVIAGGYSSESNSTATIGIRGLGPGEVKKAAPNLSELAKLENYKISLSQGKQYAASIPLKSQHIAYLKPIEKADISNTGSSEPAQNNSTSNNNDGDEDLIKKAVESLW